MKKKNIPPLPKKEEKKNNRKIAEIVLAALIIFWSVCSVLGVIGFARSCDEENSAVVTASAEEVSTYALDIPQTYVIPVDIQWNGVVYPAGLADSNIRFPYRISTFYYDTRYGRFTSYKDLLGVERAISPDSDIYKNGIVTQDSENRFGFNIPFEYWSLNENRANTFVEYVRVHCDFNEYANFQELIVNVYLSFYDESLDVESIYFTTYGADYTSPNNNLGLFGYDSEYYPYGNNLFNIHTYYIPIGYNTGFSDGEVIGYNGGYTDGDNAGYNRGYNAGVADSNEYTFNGLITSVIDVPIKAFTGLFNFEILGVNLSGFFFALLTVCVVLTVAKLFI